jgi:paraquat-inducible protein B
VTDIPPPPESPEDVPRAVTRKESPRTLQLVWIVPIVAALVGAGIAVKAFLDRGPSITIEFRTAEGIEAGKTKIKHKSVDVGTVRSVKLSADHKRVIVTAEMAPDAKDFLVEDTRFWVVRPRIAGGEVSGLSTLLAGSYIGADPGHSKTGRSEFEGLESPPVVTSDLPGRTFTLIASNLGSLDVNSPLYYRGILAGRIVSAKVADDGGGVKVDVFVQSPYDRFVTDQTRFWNASGVDFSVDANGVKLETQSLVTLLLGGIAFETPPEEPAGAPVQANARFTLWDSRSEAFRPRETVFETYVMRFAQSVRGLAVGAPVDFRGITVGRVKRIDLEFDPQTVTFRTAVQVELWPHRLRPRNARPGGRWDSTTPEQRMKSFVQHGFRGQLHNANLLTGQLYVALDFFPKQPRADIDFSQQPPEIPTLAGGLGELQESLANIIRKLEKVPFDAIGEELRKSLSDLQATLKSVDALTKHIDTELTPEMRSAIQQARKTLGAAEKVLSSDSPVQGDLRETLDQVNRAAESLRSLTDYLERHPESLLRGRREERK